MRPSRAGGEQSEPSREITKKYLESHEKPKILTQFFRKCNLWGKKGLPSETFGSLLSKVHLFYETTWQRR